MKTLLYCFMALFAVLSSAHAQTANFVLEVSTDSLLMENALEVKFKLEGQKGTDFSPPDFSEFDLISGPNHSMMTTVINGEMTQKIAYTYYLMPKIPGQFFIGPATIETEEGQLVTEPIEITVYPNPDGIIQRFPNKQRQGIDLFRSFPNFPTTPPPPPEPQKKKRKLYRM